MDVRKLSLKASKKNKAEMIEIIENGKGDMPSFKNDLNKDQILAIIYYVADRLYSWLVRRRGGSLSGFRLWTFFIGQAGRLEIPARQTVGFDLFWSHCFPGWESGSYRRENSQSHLRAFDNRTGIVSFRKSGWNQSEVQNTRIPAKTRHREQLQRQEETG